MPKTTDPQDELLIEVDSNNKIVGSLPRKIAHKSPDKIYRTIFVVVKNTDDKVLVQKRSSTKDLYPNCWDLSVGGHVNFGKSYEETAVRELYEELGIQTTEKELKYLGEVLVKLPNSNEFFQVFEHVLNPTVNIKIAIEEIKNTKWLSISEIKDSIKNNSLKWYPRPIQVIEALY